MQRINFQPISKAERSNGQNLLVHSVFFTIQGEGPNVGKPAVFLRLGGCNLQCPGCDTEYSEAAANEHIDSIITRIHMAFGDYGGDERLVVITGGEPFRQNIVALINKLVERNHSVQVETNGTLGFEFDKLTARAMARLQIVASPKSGKVHPGVERFITAYKYVLDANHIDPRDGLPTSVLGLPAAPARPHDRFDGEVYVQPAEETSLGESLLKGTQNRLNLDAAINSAMKFGYRLCLQVHKIAGLA